MGERERERGQSGRGMNVIQHKNIVNLKLEISHIKNLEIAFGFLWPRLIHGIRARQTEHKIQQNSQKQRQCWVCGRTEGVAESEREREGRGLASSPLPHIFNELDIKKF